MFDTTNRANLASQVIATLLAAALVLWVVGAHQFTYAANLVEVSDTVTDSGPSAAADHDIQFEIPASSTLAIGQDITITFAPQYTGVGTVIGGDLTATVNAGAATVGNFSVLGNAITFDLDVIANEGDVVRVIIENEKIINPPTFDQSYEVVISLANATSDTGKTRNAIVQYVTVEAEIPTRFDFRVSGMASTSQTVNTEVLTKDTSTTSIDFGALTPDVPEVGAQRLSVTSNADQGFVVTVEQDGEFESFTGAIIDSFTDGTYVNTPIPWALPGDDIDEQNTWGHWGLTSNDSDLNAGEFSTTTPQFIAASTTPRVIFSHNGPADGTTQDKGKVEVAYKIEVTPLQEAADDYSVILMYIATPTF
jgi:hypothetical protein